MLSDFSLGRRAVLAGAGAALFLGIPYARSIAGENRFLPPQPVVSWTESFVADRHADTAPRGP
ncbi:hypothetical protein Salmuc_00911 [Salipiger mucosus DSM 16094]|uniref:Carboxylesterase type B domain-containing protein n=1 Tax=Salipiger mucosus DSM 16094 TaxID=1123237 RepID=S9QSN5_9RHOB|nr:hypothetical protein Salmuc_00911 [Salipiger mucosus DSM 16094]